MKVLLVNPHNSDQGGFSSPPLGLTYLAAILLKNNIETQIVDGFLVGFAGIKKKISDFIPDIVGITCYTPGRINALEIAKYVKSVNKNIITIMGGAHPTIMWKQLMAHYHFLDICVLGEGEYTLLEIGKGKSFYEINGIVWRDNGSVIKNNPRKFTENLDDFPFPSWDLLEIHKYPFRGTGIYNGVDISKVPRIPVIFSRGCTGSCNFCSTWWIWRGHRSRSALNMANELEFLVTQYNLNHFCFYDDAFSIDLSAAKELCHEIINRKLKIIWYATTRADCVDEELLLLMKQAGCYELSYGIESGSQKILDLMKKKVLLKESIIAISKTKQAGIIASALLIIGNVGENSKTINETIDFIKLAKPDNLLYTGNLWVMPGTVLYQQMKKKGFISDDFWLSDCPYFIYPMHSNKDIEKYMFAIVNKCKIGSFKFFIIYNSVISKLNNKLKTLLFFFKPRKIVAQYKLFFGDEWLELSVDSIAKHVYKILFVISDIPWGGDQQIMGDDLNPIIEKLKNKYGDKIIIYKGAWSKQLEHVQAGLSFIKQNLPEASHCLYIDSDEIYPQNQIELLTNAIKNIRFFNRAIKIRYNAYFKTIYYKIMPEKWPKALVLFPLRKYINYYDVRSVNAGAISSEELYFEHLSYVRNNDLKIKEKLDVHRESEPIMGDWFNDIWLKWTPETHNFHPTNPEFWETAIHVNKEDLSQDIINTYLSWNKNTDEK